MSEIDRSTAIQLQGALSALEPVPDYAVDALWLEWQRVKREKPPQAMICTTGRSYQRFCQNLGEEMRAWNFPNVQIGRAQLEHINHVYSGFTKEERVQLTKILAQWEESDGETYVAFIYRSRPVIDRTWFGVRSLAQINKIKEKS